MATRGYFASGNVKDHWEDMMQRLFRIACTVLLCSATAYGIEVNTTGTNRAWRAGQLVEDIELKAKMDRATADQEAEVAKHATEKAAEARKAADEKVRESLMPPKKGVRVETLETEAKHFVALANELEIVAQQAAARAILLNETANDDEAKAREVTKAYVQHLKALRLSPSIQVNTGDAATGVAPVLEAEGMILRWPQACPSACSADCSTECKKKIVCDESCGNKQASIIEMNGKLSAKPEPAGDNAKDVANSIRIDNGTFSANLGVLAHYFPLDSKEENGPIGGEIRGGFQMSYQRAKATATDTPSATRGTKEFGIVSPEIRAGLWVKYFFLAYKLSYSNTFGKAVDVSEQINGSFTNKVAFVASLEEMVAGGGSPKLNPFYIEFDYTGGKSKLADGTFTVAILKEFDFSSLGF
jgi:hypothetical protein